MAFCPHHGGSVYISCSDNIRCGFGSHLCAWLRKQEIRITNDEAFPTGTLIALAREDAIRKSNVVIIIISKEYPTLKHCLDELEIILKYDEKKEILPVFYHIRSEDIRYQTGSFENTFIELGRNFSEQMVKIWRNGFREVAAKAAYKVNIDRDESGIVQDVTRDVCSIMKCVCSLDAKGLNDAILRPTTTHRTSSMPVSGALSKKKQIANVKVKVRQQVGSQSEEHLEKSVPGKLPSKKINRSELHRGKVTEEDASHHHKSGSTNGTYVRNPSSSNVEKAASSRTSLVPPVSVADAASSTHKMLKQTASKLKAEKEQASYDCQQYRCQFWELDAKKKLLDKKVTQLKGKQPALRNQLSDVQAKLRQSQAKGVGLVAEMQSCYDAAEVQKEVMNKCCKELKKLQPSIADARKSKADVEATMEKFKDLACLESLLAEIEEQLQGDAEVEKDQGLPHRMLGPWAQLNISKRSFQDPGLMTR